MHPQLLALELKAQALQGFARHLAPAVAKRDHLPGAVEFVRRGGGDWGFQIPCGLPGLPFRFLSPGVSDRCPDGLLPHEKPRHAHGHVQAHDQPDAQADDQVVAIHVFKLDGATRKMLAANFSRDSSVRAESARGNQ